MARIWIVLALMMPLLGACGDGPSRVAPQTQVASGKDAPAQLEVICRRDGSTELVTDEVQAQPDGVHIQVDNRADEFVSLNGVGWDFDPGVSTHVAALEPGELGVACWPGSMHRDTEPEKLSIRIHDPEGLFEQAEIDCGEDEMMESVSSEYAPDSEGIQGEPAEIARDEVGGIEDSDRLFTTGYPEANDGTVAVERDGKVIALLGYSPSSDGGWLLGGWSACSSADIRG